MIVIPMAGLSRRFQEAGYPVPKYMLEAGGRSLFAHSVLSFEAYFDSLPFLFIYRDVQGTDAFVRAEAARVGIRDARFVVLEAPTLGQADTVWQGLTRSGADRDAPITVFNIDTVRPGFRFPGADVMDSAGYLEVFRGEGDNWSFVGPAPDQPGRVARTTEKDPISDLCSDGLYHFAHAGSFTDAYEAALDAQDATRGEYYIAPLYNRLIAAGLDIRYAVVPREDIVFSGVPAEYEAFRAQLES